MGLHGVRDATIRVLEDLEKVEPSWTAEWKLTNLRPDCAIA